MLCSFAFGWLIGGPVWIVVAIGLVYGFTALGDSPIYSTSITEVVAPATYTLPAASTVSASTWSLPVLPR